MGQQNRHLLNEDKKDEQLIFYYYFYIANQSITKMLYYNFNIGNEYIIKDINHHRQCSSCFKVRPASWVTRMQKMWMNWQVSIALVFELCPHSRIWQSYSILFMGSHYLCRSWIIFANLLAILNLTHCSLTNTNILLAPLLLLSIFASRMTCTSISIS